MNITHLLYTDHIGKQHVEEATAMTVSPDGQYLLTGAVDGTIKLWDVFGARLTYIGSYHKGAILSLAWSPDGKYFASGAEDTSVFVRNSTGLIETGFHGHQAGVHIVAWSPDGQNLATASSDKTVNIWSVFTGKCIETYHDDSDFIDTLIWLSDNKRILARQKSNKILILHVP